MSSFPYSSIGTVLFSSDSFKFFFFPFIFNFWSLDVIPLGIGFLDIYPTWALWASEAVVWCLAFNLGELLSHYSCKYCFCVFLSSPGVPISHMLYILWLPHDSWIFYSIFTPLLFHFGRFFCHILMFRNIFFLVMSIKGILHFCYIGFTP